jgi:hypothetical protein
MCGAPQVPASGVASVTTVAGCSVADSATAFSYSMDGYGSNARVRTFRVGTSHRRQWMVQHVTCAYVDNL